MKRWAMMVLFLFGSLSAQEVENVSAALKKESAWTGEGVTMTVILRSPGPFSGTATFDLPQVSQTAFMKVGNPVVGSETVNGESFLSQTHRFAVYSQLEGKVVIPSFTVRFSGKKTFTGEAEPMEGKTKEISYQSNRPEGTEGIGFLVTSVDMEISQTWSPTEGREVDAGDVLRRTITRIASDISAMAFPPVNDGAPEGVKVYGDDPVVEDKEERGVFSAKREETLRYQFVRAGTFTIPELTFYWWDPKAEELKQLTLPGETVTVRLSETAVASMEAERKVWPWVFFGGGVLIALWIFRRRISGLYREWDDWRHRPEAVSAKSLLAACRAHDPKAAYLAAMAWQQAVGIGEGDYGNENYSREITDLSACLFGDSGGLESWNGESLAKNFREVRRQWNIRGKSRTERAVLPALNS